MRTYVRTHGGLGNQLFQVFYVLCKYGVSSEVSFVHDGRYPNSHGRELNSKFFKIGAVRRSDSAIANMLVRSRVVKVLEKLGVSEPRVNLGFVRFCDGYFQNPEIYNGMSGDALAGVVYGLADLFGIGSPDDNRTLYHLRLSDFFNSDCDRVRLAKQVLGSVERGSAVITTDDRLLLGEPELVDNLLSNRIEHIITEGMAPEDVLKLMSRFSKIVSNDSTLAFWASVLSRSCLDVRRNDLSRLKCILDVCCEEYSRAECND